MYGPDFLCFYYTAQSTLRGAPYAAGCVFNPVHVLIASAPIGWLSAPVAWAAWMLLGVGGFIAAFRRLGMTWPVTLACMASPPVVYCLWYGNIDWLPILGLTLPGAWGVLAMSAKPQMTFVALAVMLVISIRRRALIRDWLPLGISAVLSLVLGWHAPVMAAMGWNVAAWPLTLVVGVPLAVLALRRLDVRIGMAASVLCTPYAGIYSFAALLPELARGPVIGLVVATWWVMVLLK